MKRINLGHTFHFRHHSFAYPISPPISSWIRVKDATISSSLEIRLQTCSLSLSFQQNYLIFSSLLLTRKSRKNHQQQQYRVTTTEVSPRSLGLSVCAKLIFGTKSRLEPYVHPGDDREPLDARHCRVEHRVPSAALDETGHMRGVRWIWLQKIKFQKR